MRSAASRDKPMNAKHELILIRIDITVEAFDAIAATLPDSDTYELEIDGKGQRHVWFPPFVVDRLRFLRNPGESYSDVIIRLTGRLNAAPDAGERRREQTRERVRRWRPVRRGRLSRGDD
jgi:hypothetical protein